MKSASSKLLSQEVSEGSAATIVSTTCLIFDIWQSFILRRKSSSRFDFAVPMSSKYWSLFASIFFLLVHIFEQATMTINNSTRKPTAAPIIPWTRGLANTAAISSVEGQKKLEMNAYLFHIVRCGKEARILRIVRLWSILNIYRLLVRRPANKHTWCLCKRAVFRWPRSIRGLSRSFVRQAFVIDPKMAAEKD